MRYFLRHITKMHMPVAILLLVCALGMWVVDYIRMPEQWVMLLFTQIMSLMNALLLCSVLYRSKASAHYSLLPGVIYVVMVAVFPYMRLHGAPHFMALLLLFYLLITRDLSEDNESNGIPFFITLLLSLLAYFSPDALWCIIFLWVVVIVQGCFSLRTVIASLLAVALCAVYYQIAVYLGWLESVNWPELIHRQWLGNVYQPMVVIAVISLLAAFIYVVVAAFQRSSYDLVSTRMILYQVVLLGVLSAPLIILPPSRPDSLVLLPLSLAATTGIYLLQKESESRGITLLVYLAGAIVLYISLIVNL